MKVHESCVWCGKLITSMPDTYDPLRQKPVCSEQCREREQWFTVTHCNMTMNILTAARFGKSQAEVPRYKGSS